MNTEFLKLRTMVSRTISVFMCKSSIYFSAMHFRPVPPHFVYSDDGTDTGAYFGGHCAMDPPLGRQDCKIA